MHPAFMLSALMHNASKLSDDREFLENYDPAAFDRPSVTVDVVLLAPDAGDLLTVVARRHEPPHRGQWALPGGFVHMDESLDDAAARVLAEKAGYRGIFLEQLYTFGEPKRDPRMRIISVGYYALVPAAELSTTSEDVQLAHIRVPWEGETGGPVMLDGPNGSRLSLAFDHDQIVGMAVKRIRGKLNYTPIGFELLPETFTMTELQRVHETVLGNRVNPDSFRRRMLASGLLEPTGATRKGTGHRNPLLYRRAKSAKE